jgi:hypothetical protein
MTAITPPVPLGVKSPLPKLAMMFAAVVFPSLANFTSMVNALPGVTSPSLAL